jgi:hypothetical protein
MWVLTVLSAITSVSAISRLEQPAAIRRSTTSCKPPIQPNVRMLWQKQWGRLAKKVVLFRANCPTLLQLCR